MRFIYSPATRWCIPGISTTRYSCNREFHARGCLKISSTLQTKMGESTSKHPLVWIDCEMTGLDISKEEIIQIACYVTDYDLNVLDPEGFEIVVKQPKDLLDGMDEWCTRTHAKTGLTERVLASDISPETAADNLLQYVTKYAPTPGRALLAGNSVHYDKEFMRKGPYVKVLNHLHHRILDVSSIKEAARRWSDRPVIKNLPKKLGTHEARQDILESIAEAKYYRDVVFKPAKAENADENTVTQSTPAS